MRPVKRGGNHSKGSSSCAVSSKVYWNYSCRVFLIQETKGDRRLCCHHLSPAEQKFKLDFTHPGSSFIISIFDCSFSRNLIQLRENELEKKSSKVACMYTAQVKHCQQSHNYNTTPFSEKGHSFIKLLHFSTL